ncbi:carboxylating nicotinate-nucleotide diphosphorylase [Phosphitispora fastidiosa]|uniref:carboxylating nicotinate-nucleotide diphosphorylase n=1 Tax=Phosphitispora fastidiosa TaxID=2837202 RepID=UPI001E41296F|nr:nicotinate-nucleotide pyrophosphorylase (carboxylating) [Phosphitispora fastidiosa]
MHINVKLLDEIIAGAIKEDVGTGDLTTMSTVPEGAVTEGYIYAKETGVIAGTWAAERVFQFLSHEMQFTYRKRDGDIVEPGDVIAVISGPAGPILTGERVALNLLQRLSGIATRTAAITNMVKGFNCIIVDTRKTTPGLRALEKYAVTVGGGRNHRFGLYDGILIKDNHIKVAGGIANAVAMARAKAPHTLKVEVEVEDLKGVCEALEAGADIIMLDNMDFEAVSEAVKLINHRAQVEVSGGVTEDTAAGYARAGADIISMGALTHSVKSLDISLDIREIKIRPRSQEAGVRS